MTTAQLLPGDGTTRPAVGAPLDRRVRPLRAAYADPPYLGLAHKFYGHLHPDAAEYDKLETHKRLIEMLCDEYDCWALSLHTPTLKTMLAMCPDDVRVMPWVKPFASFKPGVGVAYAWEPLIVRGGRRRTREQRTVRDWVSEPITLRRGFAGAKPAAVLHWLFEVWNLLPGDEFSDLFPGSGAVSAAWDEWSQRNEPVQHGLFQGPNVRAKRATAAWRQARAAENVARRGPGLVPCRWRSA